MNQKNSLKNGRPTIALLANSMTSFYHEKIMRGAEAAAEERNLNIIVYSGGPLNSPSKADQSREAVFDLVDMNLVDGVIAPFSSHTRYLGTQETQAFISSFSSCPIVNIGSQIKGCLNIVADFEPGLTQLMDHYIINHKYKKIALFRGPKGHIASDQRTEIYKKQLQKHGISVDENLIVYSDLSKRGGLNSIEDFIDTKKMSCDAIISLNDNMAIAVIDALQKRNIRVPQDIAISGTMGIPAGLFSTPSLTTIKEPVYEMGKAAVYAIADTLNGKEVPFTTFLPTSLIFRNSCGCTPLEHKIFSQDLTQNSTSIIPKIKIETLESRCLNILKQTRSLEDLETLRLILDKYKKAKKSQQFESFLTSLCNKLESMIQIEKIVAWLEITSEIQINLYRYSETLKNHEKYKEPIEQLVLLKSLIENKLVKIQKIELNRYNSFFQQLLKLLNTSFDLKAVKDSVMETLNISDFYISVYSAQETNTQFAENVIAVREKKIITTTEKNKIFLSKKLIPSNRIPYTERYSLIIFPLSFRKNPLGFLILNLSENNGSTYENLQVSISTALKNELQIQDLKKAEQRFSDIAHSTSNWLWETDEQNKFTYSSLSVQNIIGYSNNEILEYKINSFLIPGKDSFYQKILKKEIISDKECWFHHKNGNIMCLLISAKPIFKEGIFKGYRGVFEDITEQKIQTKKINYLAFHDVLTDLPNRAMFLEKLQTIIDSATKNKSKFALMFLDIDRFKYINDSLGHNAGDSMLIHVSQLLQKSIRNRDILARLGGDEFTIILPNIVNESQVLLIAKRILKNLETPITLKDKEFHVTMSFGIAIFPTDGNDTTTLLRKSDNAMYQAKSQGRNSFVFFNKKIEQMNTLRKLQEDDLNEALNNNKFTIYYQPQVDTMSGAVLGVEALVRINNKLKGIIAPNNFIPLAEELGLICHIDEWVFKESCRQYSEWCSMGYKPIRISINISTLQLRNKNLVKTYMSIINSYKINPKDIQLEITESTLIKNEDMALKILEDFKKNGISIALDDFGTGYSSFHVINLYPIDTIKIDRSFVTDAITNKKNEAIIKAILHLATSLNLKVIAEGVETIEQYEFIKSLGCDEIQGYYFYKPTNTEDMKKILTKKQ